MRGRLSRNLPCRDTSTSLQEAIMMTLPQRLKSSNPDIGIDRFYGKVTIKYINLPLSGNDRGH